MDANIDPSIADPELYSSPRPSQPLEALLHALHDNVLHLNEYVAATTAQHQQPHQPSPRHDDSTAAAALNMIQFNTLVGAHDSSRENLENLYPYYDTTHLPAPLHLHHPHDVPPYHHHHPQPGTVRDSPVVHYNPAAKPKRLGRPRKHLVHKLASPENSSSQNYNESVMSKFRFDEQPIEGPGSRGGKVAAKLPKGKITSAKKRKQSQLGFQPVKPDDDDQSAVSEAAETADNDADPVKPVDSPTGPPPPKKKLKLILNPPGRKDADKELLQQIIEDSTKISQDILARKQAGEKKRKPVKKTQNSKLTSTSRTTVVNPTKKITRQLPGPLVGLNYDLYDDNVIDASQNFETKKEKLALGYPVVEAPYASDILYIIAFLNKFQEVVPFPPIGPQDFEVGLCLPELDLGKPTSSPYNKKQVATPPELPTEVSVDMKELFLRLMSLILNRKKLITSFKTGIQELKSMTLYLGLPKEWKQPQTQKHQEQPEVAEEPVDLSRSDVYYSKVFTSADHPVVYNPFYDSDFEANGLDGLDPRDRLVLLRTLIKWSLTTSEVMKTHIALSVLAQDIPGDKDTYYASRALVKGFKNAEITKKEAEAKLAKRDDDVKYYDPTSNPLNHSFRLRLNEELVGDGGFTVGRFFLCRMAYEGTGGLASLKKMTSTWAGPPTEPPCPFKLYVQDVHQLLIDSFANEGIEFDSKGKEVLGKFRAADASEHWYEIAATSDELELFVAYLAARLGVSVDGDGSLVEIPMSSMIYRPILNLHDYLDQVTKYIKKQESLQVGDKRTSRSKGVDYNDKTASNYESADEEVVEEFHEHDENDDDDYDEFQDDGEYDE